MAAAWPPPGFAPSARCTRSGQALTGTAEAAVPTWAARLAFYNLFRFVIPHCYGLIEIGVVGQVAPDGCVIAEDFIFDHWLSGANGVEEVRFVVNHVAITVRRGVTLYLLFYLEGVRSGLRMFILPLF